MLLEQVNGSISPTHRDHGIVASIVSRNCSRRDTRRRFAYSTSVNLIWSLRITNSRRHGPHTGQNTNQTNEKSALP